MTHLLRRRALLAAGTAAVVVAAACTDYLKVTNPGSVSTSQLGDSVNAGLLVNGAIAEFQSMIGVTAMYGGLLTDETRNAHVNISFVQVDARDFTDQLDIDAIMYSSIQRARFDGDTVAARLIAWDGPVAGTDPRVARMLAFEAYSLVQLGEAYCAAPVSLSRAYTPTELFQMALPKFDSALAIARAAAGAGKSTASADSLANLALVGAARAELDLGDLQKAASYAAQVTPGFNFWVYYVEGIPPASGVPVNPLYNAEGSPVPSSGPDTTFRSGGFLYSSGSLWEGVDTTFQNLNDPRVPHTPTRVRAMNGSMMYVPNQSRSFSGYRPPSATLPGGQAMTPGAAIRVASYVEAQYIVAEAAGGNASTLAFVNAQRAANGQPPSTAATPAEVLADLRDQRRREFYMDGHRLGDLRRYKAQYGIDLFQTGAYNATRTYGTVECFPIPLSERNSNPNLGNS